MTIFSTLTAYADEAISYYHNDNNVPEITQEQLDEISASSIADYIEFDLHDLYKNANLGDIISSLDDLDETEYDNETTFIHTLLPDLAVLIANKF